MAKKMADDITISGRAKKIQEVLIQEGISAEPSDIAKILDVVPSSFSRWLNNESEPRGKQKEKVDLLYRIVCEVEKGNTQEREILHRLGEGCPTGIFGASLLNVGKNGVLCTAGLGWFLTGRDPIQRILDKANPKELHALAEILDVKTPHQIVEAFWRNGQSILGYQAGGRATYSQIVQKAAETLEINPTGVIIDELEIEIAGKLLKTAWEKMTLEERVGMEAELRRTVNEFDQEGEFTESPNLFAALTDAQLSKFGIYLLSSTTLSLFMEVISIPLPFVVYSNMSRAIAEIIGPVDWMGAGLLAICNPPGTNFKRLIPVILYVSVLRAKQQGHFSDGPSV